MRLATRLAGRKRGTRTRARASTGPTKILTTGRAETSVRLATRLAGRVRSVSTKARASTGPAERLTTGTRRSRSARIHSSGIRSRGTAAAHDTTREDTQSQSVCYVQSRKGQEHQHAESQSVCYVRLQKGHKHQRAETSTRNEGESGTRIRIMQKLRTETTQEMPEIAQGGGEP